MMIATTMMKITMTHMMIMTRNTSAEEIENQNEVGVEEEEVIFEPQK